MPLEYTQFKAQLRQGSIQPGYFLAGYKSPDVTKLLEFLQPLLRNRGPEVFIEKYDAPEGVLRALVSAQSFPMMQEHKLILIRDMQLLVVKGKEGEKEKEKEIKALSSYFRDPSSWATILLISDDSLPAGVLKKISPNLIQIEPPKLTGAELRIWAQQEFTKRDLKIEPPALELLLKTCKEDWPSIEQEIEKLALSKPPGTRITQDDLEAVAEPLLREDVFALTNALSADNIALALEKLEILQNTTRGNKQSQMIQIWGLLYNQIRNMLVMMEVNRRKLPPQEAQLAGVSPKAMRVIGEQSRRFSREALRDLMASLEKIDRQLKSSYTAQSSVLLEYYMVRLGQIRRKLGARK